MSPPPMKASATVDGKQGVLVLGCGLVAPPLIHFFAQHEVPITIASRTRARAEEVAAGLKGVTCVEFDITKPDADEKLAELIPGHRLVFSLLPYVYHVQAAKQAIAHKTHFLTTSYVKPEMAALDEEAKKAGVLLLNECGVDPGLDHASAKRVIDEVHAKGGKILSFFSVCGGLPSPQHNDNPLGYKLSWSPRGVLLASRNNAKYLDGGKIVEVEGVDLYTPAVHRTDRIPGLDADLEWYPNRDSTDYIEIYGIPEVQTIIRGTYRFSGWCRWMRTMAVSGFTDLTEKDFQGVSYAEFTRDTVGLSADTDLTQLRAALAARLNMEEDDDVLDRIAWLGLLDPERKVPAAATTALDAVCVLMEEKMQYSPGQQDMIAMKHTFEVEYRDESKEDGGVHRETITSVLLDYGQQNQKRENGEPGFSSMARTVTLPVAQAALAVLEGRMTVTGVYRPVDPEVYNPILDALEKDGIRFTERVEKPTLWLRDEVKPGEGRVALTPQNAATAIEKGFRVVVERSETRCYRDEEYEQVGCELANTGSWENAPLSAFILGLKELPETGTPLRHRHIYFAHCFKNQDGWKGILERFSAGQGQLLDLEFLVDENGRRVAAFGRAAGVAGMAVGLVAWAEQVLSKGARLMEGPLKPWQSTEHLLEDVRQALKKAAPNLEDRPKVLILGALGRCGSGAAWVARQVGLEPILWDLEETKKGGPFKELVDVDILVNCIYLNSKIPPFLTEAEIDVPSRKLSIVVDVSCDITNPHNPLPFCNQGTTLETPAFRVRDNIQSAAKRSLDCITIDHLPTLTPVDSSVEFSDALLPHLLHLVDDPRKTPVWSRAAKVFEEKVQLL